MLVAARITLDTVSPFTEYSAIKRKLQGLTYKGYDLCKPAAAIIANHLYDDKPLLRKWRKALRLIWLEPRHSNRDNLQGHVLAWNTPRTDHKLNAERVALAIDGSAHHWHMVHVPDITKDCRRTGRLDMPWRALRLTLASRVGAAHFLYTLAALTYTLRYFASVERLGLVQGIERLIAYNSSNIPECFLTSACKRNGIRTFSLQHGLYHDYLTTPPLAVINYENVTADALLVWSEFCKMQIEAFFQREGRVADFSMPLAGYLKPVPPERIPATAQPRQRVLCLLPRGGVESSIRLVKLLGQLSAHCDVLLRPHPALRKNKVFLEAVPSSLEMDENPLLETTLGEREVSLAVGFNTTSLFDTLLMQVPCALYQTPQTTFDAPQLPHFADADQLLALLEQARPRADVAAQILGAGIFRYAEIVND